MSTTFKTQVFGILFLSAVSLWASAADISGIWEITLQSPQGDETVFEINIEQDGDKIMVTMQGIQGEEVTAEGTIKDNEVEWTVDFEAPSGEKMSIFYSGSVEGDTMKGQAELPAFGSMEWTAKKK